ncbi:MAG: ERCC4-related helicase [Candidatus Woesearchaeota archaeon]|jgi:ERCC4-related helicase
MKLSTQLKPRLYQELISTSCVKTNSLVVLPTGLGKTFISLLVVLHRLKLYPDSKIIIVAPTKPLVNQHLKSFESLLDSKEGEIVAVTGTTAPAKRAEQYSTAKIIFSTPQGLENDIIASRIKLREVSLFVFDEAHRATGEYSYVWLADQYEQKAKNGLILGLTASPGSDKEKITEVLDSLRIKQIEFRERTAPDVAPYLQETTLRYIEMDLPPLFAEVQKLLRTCYGNKVSDLKSMGFFQQKTVSSLKKIDLLQFIGSLQREIAQQTSDGNVFSALSISAQALKISHGLELVESQGIECAHEYLKTLIGDGKAGKSKAATTLSKDPHVRLAFAKATEMLHARLAHPKMEKSYELVEHTIRKTPDAKIIIFSQFRDSLKAIMNHLNTIPTVDARMFVGQAKKKGSGMTQKEQLAMIEDFEAGEFNVICMSSVGEEGLDIPSVNTVIFYEPVPSVIRSIQRKGRTGRHADGEVFVLCTKNTKDIAYKWIAMKKERSMYDILAQVQKERSGIKQESLATFTTAKKTEYVAKAAAVSPVAAKTVAVLQEQTALVKVIADTRESGSQTVRCLHDMDLDLQLQHLKLGDFVLSQDVVAEVKRVPDFVDSILDGRLLAQLRELKANVLKPIVIVEGDESLFAVRNVHPNSIYGMLSTITISYQIPILFTRTAQETSSLLFMVARREQQGTVGSNFTPHASNKPSSLTEQLEYIISSVPNVGLSLAKRLLTHFGTVEKVVAADVEDISAIQGIGKQKAVQIYNIFRESYSE